VQTDLGGENYILDDTSYVNGKEGIEQVSDSVTFKVTHQLGDHELVYLAGYATFDKETWTDNDFSASDILEVYDVKEYEQLSHELRIVSPKGENIDYIAGIYYLDREFTHDRMTHVFAETPFFRHRFYIIITKNQHQ